MYSEAGIEVGIDASDECYRIDVALEARVTRGKREYGAIKKFGALKGSTAGSFGFL